MATTSQTPLTDALAGLKEELAIPTRFQNVSENTMRAAGTRLNIEFIEPDPIVARLLINFLSKFCKDARFVVSLNFHEPDNFMVGRRITLDISKSDSKLLVDALTRFKEELHAHPAVAAQYEDARQLILEGIDNDKIEGVYPSIILERTQPPRINLHIENAPKRLARQLAEKTGQDFDELPDCQEGTANYDRTQMFTGGKDIAVPMDHPNIGEVRVLIMNYSEHAARSHDPEAHLTPGRKIDRRPALKPANRNPDEPGNFGR